MAPGEYKLECRTGWWVMIAALSNGKIVPVSLGTRKRNVAELRAKKLLRKPDEAR